MRPFHRLVFLFIAIIAVVSSEHSNSIVQAAEDQEKSNAPTTIFLGECNGWVWKPNELDFGGQLVVQLAREAFLLTAREEFGLATLDQSLGDPLPRDFSSVFTFKTREIVVPVTPKDTSSPGKVISTPDKKTAASQKTSPATKKTPTTEENTSSTEEQPSPKSAANEKSASTLKEKAHLQIKTNITPKGTPQKSEPPTERIEYLTTSFDIVRGEAGKGTVCATCDWNYPREGDYVKIIDYIDRLASEKFIPFFESLGCNRRHAEFVDSGPVPEGILSLIDEMTFPAQFSALRQVHKLMREEGESPERLGALIRAYANLGVLIECHWHPAHKAFKARALLYAGRLMKKSKGSPWALWQRAYAYTLIGLHKAALDDLAAAKTALEKMPETDRPAPPAWLDYIEAACRYDIEKIGLIDTSEASGQLAQLLCFYVAGEYYSKNRTLELGMRVAEIMPECYWIRERLSHYKTKTQDVGLGNEYDLALIERRIAACLEAMPDRPPAVNAILSRERSSSNRENFTPADEFLLHRDLTAALCNGETNDAAEKNPSVPEASAWKDNGEPSWASFGSMLREMDITEVWLRKILLHNDHSENEDAFSEVTKPLWENHPASLIIGSLQSKLVQIGRMQAIIQAVPKNRFMPHASGYILAMQYSQNQKQHFPTVFAQIDALAWEMNVEFYQSQPLDVQKRFGRYCFENNPYSPYARSIMIQQQWDEVKESAKTWEKEQPNCPMLLETLAFTYFDRARSSNPYEKEVWNNPRKRTKEEVIAEQQERERKKDELLENALRTAKAALACEPSERNHQVLAGIYRFKGESDKEIDTYNEFLNTSERSYDNEGQIRKIAEDLIQRRKYNEALPFAKRSAADNPGWGLRTLGRCKEAMGDLDGAEKAFRQLADDFHFGEGSETHWYMFCQRSGLGDHDKSLQYTDDFFNSGSGYSKTIDAIHVRTLRHMMEKDTAKIGTDIEAMMNGPKNGFVFLLAAVYANEGKDLTSYLDRFKNEKKLGILSGANQYLLTWVNYVEDDLDKDAKGKTLVAFLERIPEERNQFYRSNLYLLTARFLADRGKTNEAIYAWKRGFAEMLPVPSNNGTLAAWELRKHGVGYKELLSYFAPTFKIESIKLTDGADQAD